MVGKLIKHELKALFRIILYVGVGAIVVAAIGRIIYAADSNSVVGFLFSLISIYAAIVAIFMAFVASIGQFSRAFFTGEGYMTFSLPATPTQLIVSKLVSALVATFYGVAVAVLCGLIFISGIEPSFLEEVGEIFGELWSLVSEYLASDPILIFELILLFLASLPMSLLFFYLIICVGQLFTGARKGLTFAIAIGALILVSVLNSYALTPLLNVMENVSVHLSMWTQIILYCGLDVGMFFAIRYILTHRVNLIV